MTSYREDQQLELEALESLFPGEGEFKRKSSTEFELLLRPHGVEFSEDPVYVDAVLSVVFPPTYPDAAPLWKFVQHKGLDPAQLSELHHYVEEEINRHLGTPMVYMMAEAIQTYLSANNHPPQSNYDAMMQRRNPPTGITALSPNDEAKAADTSVNEHADGGSDSSDDGSSDADRGEFKGLAEKQLCAADERITEDQFNAWKERFSEEMVARGLWRKAKYNDTRLTGKQMFERDHSLAKAEVDDDLDVKGGSALMWSDANLFTEEDPALEDLDLEEN